MKIAACHPFTLSDFPGKSAAIVFTQGCNFRCRYCHNPGLLPLSDIGGDRVCPDEVMQFLEKRKGKLQGVVISGGEPTLQKGLMDFMSTVKHMDYAVKLDTNGSAPEVLRELLEHGLVDYVAMDIKAPPGKYAEITGVPFQPERVTRGIGLIIDSGLPYEFRTTVDKRCLSPGDLLACGAWIKGAKNYILQPVSGAGVNYTRHELTRICTRITDSGIPCKLR